MSKFLTPPVWYDSNGNLVEILTGSVTALPSITFTNSMSIGKRSLVTGSYSIAIGEDAHTYEDNTIAIGYQSQSPAQGSIAIGSNTVAYSSATGAIGSIAIGNGSKVYGNGSIAIGSGIQIGSDVQDIDYTIQIGATDKTYSAQIGDGNSTLKCICSKAQTTSFTNEDWIICQKTTENPSPRAIITDIEATYQIVVFYENTTKSSCSAIVYAGGAIGDFAQVIRFSTKTVDSDETSFYVQNAYTVLISSVPEQEGKWLMQVHNREAKNTYTNMGFKYRKIK